MIWPCNPKGKLGFTQPRVIKQCDTSPKLPGHLEIHVKRVLCINAAQSSPRLKFDSQLSSILCKPKAQNSKVWRPNIHVWTHFEPIFSLLVHGSTQTKVTQLAGVCGRRRKIQLSCFTIGCWLFIYLCREDLKKKFSPSRNRFLWSTPTSQDRSALRQLLARFFHV